MNNDFEWIFFERSAKYYGSAVNLVDQCEYIAKTGEKVSVVVAESGELIDRIRDKNGIQLIVQSLPKAINKYDKKLLKLSLFKKLTSLLHLLAWNTKLIFTLRNIITTRSILVVNNTRTFFFFFPTVLFVKIFWRRKVIWKVQTTSYPYRVAMPLFSACSNMIFFYGGVKNLSSFTTAAFGSLKKRSDKIVNMDNPVDVLKYRKKQVGESKTFNRFPVKIMMVGEIKRDKGTRDGVEIIMQLRNEGVDAKLYHYGEMLNENNGEYASELHNFIISNDLNSHVKFMGYRKSLVLDYIENDILLHCSYIEAKPLIILEASASALPTVSYEVGGISEQVVDQKTGFLLPVGDIKSAVKALTRLANNPSKSLEMGQNARDYVTAKFNHEIINSKFVCNAKTRK